MFQQCFISVPINVVFLFPPLILRLLDKLHGLGVEVSQFVHRRECVIDRLIVRSELERDGQRAALGLHGEVVSRLVVELVLGGEPHRHVTPHEARKDGLFSSFVVPLLHQRLDVLVGRFADTLHLHIVGRAVVIVVHVPADAPLVFYGVEAFDGVYVVVSLYSYHSERDLKN